MYFTDHCNPSALKPVHCFPWHARHCTNAVPTPTHLPPHARTLVAEIVIVTPLGELSNFQSLNSLMSLFRNHCCCISLSLKMTNGCRCRPSAEIYSMMIVYSYLPGFFLKVLYFSTMLNIRLLAPMLYIRPVSSIFYWSACMTFLIIDRSKNGNYAWITSVVALLIWAISIRRVWRVLTDGLYCKNLFNQCFPIPAVEPPARRIRLTNIWICAYVGPRPRASCIRIHSANRFSWIGDSFCSDVYMSILDCRPVRRCRKMALVCHSRVQRVGAEYPCLPRLSRLRARFLCTKALVRFRIGCMSNLRAVRLELAVLLSFEKGWSKFWWCVASGGASLPGVGT